MPVFEHFVALEGGGTTFAQVEPEARDRAALTDQEARRIASCARAIAEAEGMPQDIEWALVGDGEARELVVLQTRPITTLGDPASATGDESRLGASVAATEGLNFSCCQPAAISASITSRSGCSCA